MNAQVVGISIDSKHANRAWAESLGGITYPLLSDFYPHGAVADAYGVLRPQGMSERALFVIDTDGVVRYIDVHELREVPDENVLFEELAKLG
jgi:alkyl hydroperoxide reductase subunit AhpC